MGSTLLFMLGWLPFRLQNLSQLKLLAIKLISPSDYFWLGMRENVYLITAIVLILVICAYFISNWAFKIREKANGLPYLTLEAISLGTAIFIIFVFLRPMTQFIYFQF